MYRIIESFGVCGRRAVSEEELLGDCKVVPRELKRSLERLKEFLAPFTALLVRREQREHGGSFIRGLLSDLERKSVEPIAVEFEGDRQDLQHFIGVSNWDHRPMLDELVRQVAAELGSADGVLVLDPSAFPKKGDHSVGVARQWCGRLGKVENCQLGVFLGYASNKGHTVVDERLYLPDGWAKDKARRQACHVPLSVRFRTAQELGLEMLESRRSELPHAWVTGDDEFGRSSKFRKALVKMGERYLLEIPSNISVRDMEALPPVATGESGRPRKTPFQQVGQWKATVPQERWSRIHVRDGTKGPVAVSATRVRVCAKKMGTKLEWLLIIRTEDPTPEYRYYLGDAGTGVSLEEMVYAVHARFWIEDCFARGKGETGLDHYEVRAWQGWHHHITLSLMTLWFLTQERRRLAEKTPAMTVPQAAYAMAEMLRDPDTDLDQLALTITQKLQRSEQSRIGHWRKHDRLPSRWNL